MAADLGDASEIRIDFDRSHPLSAWHIAILFREARRLMTLAVMQVAASKCVSSQLHTMTRSVLIQCEDSLFQSNFAFSFAVPVVDCRHVLFVRHGDADTDVNDSVCCLSW